MRLAVHAVVVVFFYALFAAAWPWPPQWLESNNGVVVRRAEGDSKCESIVVATILGG